MEQAVVGETNALKVEMGKTKVTHLFTMVIMTVYHTFILDRDKGRLLVKTFKILNTL